jgi:signal recognition particle receptor subunit beta
MDRKVKIKYYDIPGHQRWLYKLSDYGLVKAIMLIWGICLLLLVASFLLVKLVLAFFK